MSAELSVDAPDNRSSFRHCDVHDEQCIDSFSKQSAWQKISSSRWPVMFSCLVIKGDVGLSVYLMQKSFL